MSEPSVAFSLAAALPRLRPVGSTIRLLYGDLRTGRIYGEIDAADAPWSAAANGAGAITPVTVTENVVRALRLRWTAPAVKTFLAVEVDDRIQEAGPIWTRTWDDERGLLTLGAAGLWSLWDHRKVLPAILTPGAPGAGQPTAQLTTTLTGADRGEIARGLVAQAMTELGGDLPVVLPAARPGTAYTETYPGYKMQWVGNELLQLTQREEAAPDIRFRARRKADRRFLEWVMETGTAAAPQLVQAGRDWMFDHRARRSPVVRISTDEDATVMAQRAFSLGSGMEAGQLIARASDSTLLDQGWPLTEIDELRSNVEDQATLLGHAQDLRTRSARPIEVFKVVVRASAAAEVQPGDYCRLRPKTQNAWLGEVGERRMRVAKKSGGLGDDITLDMYPLEAIL